VAERESNKESVPRNHKSNMKTGLQLKEIMPNESLQRYHKNNVKTGFRLKEKLPKKLCPGKNCLKCKKLVIAQIFQYILTMD